MGPVGCIYAFLLKAVSHLGAKRYNMGFKAIVTGENLSFNVEFERLAVNPWYFKMNTFNDKII